MKYEQRRKELIQGLKATGNQYVTVAINHVAEVLGIEKAEELHSSGTLVHISQAVRFKRAGDGSQTVAKTLQAGLAEFEREPLLEALEAAPEQQAMQTTPKEVDPRLSKESEKTPASGVPGELNQSTASHKLVEGPERNVKVDAGAKTNIQS